MSLLVWTLTGLICGAYAIGARRAWSGSAWPRTVAFVAGAAILALAVASPLAETAEHQLAAHMLQHELLVVVAAPLMALAEPGLALLWVLRAPWRVQAAAVLKPRLLGGVWSAASRPASAFAIHAVTFWIWHMPVLYDAAVQHEWLHVLEHATFFGTAALFWWSLISRHSAAAYGSATFFMFLAALQSSALGALLVVSGHVWYSPYLTSSAAAAVEDQQRAGLLMWVPFGLPFIAGGLAFLAACLRAMDRRTSALRFKL